jgi:drug/metabolite transporter (DMT)-like permease
MNFIGEIAALATACFFAMTALIFTSTGRVIGSQLTNRMRLTFALVYLVILNLVIFREPLPFSAESSRWLWLSLSGVIGLSLGDAFLFQSMIAVGPRLSSLLLSLAPIFGTILAWIFFGEILTLAQITGIALALAGIGWVVVSHEEPPETPHGHTRSGVIFGVLAALGQAVGLILSKQGMSGDFSPFQANVIRILAAAIFIWAWAAFDGQAGRSLEDLRGKPRILGLLALGAFIGPVLGVTGSLLAIQHAEIGIASTLMSLTPVILLPVSHFVFKEQVTWQAILGTILAIAGVAILFLA